MDYCMGKKTSEQTLNTIWSSKLENEFALQKLNKEISLQVPASVNKYDHKILI